MDLFSQLSEALRPVTPGEMASILQSEIQYNSGETKVFIEKITGFYFAPFNGSYHFAFRNKDAYCRKEERIFKLSHDCWKQMVDYLQQKPPG